MFDNFRRKVYYVDTMPDQSAVTDQFGKRTVQDWITYIGTKRAKLVLCHTDEVEEHTKYPFSSSVTIPEKITLKIEEGAICDLDSVAVLTIGKAKIGSYQVFTGAGTVSFGSGAVKKVRPEWWQNNTTPGTTDMATAINAALQSMAVPHLKLLGYAYATGSAINITVSNTLIEGDGKGRTWIQPSAGVDAFVANTTSHSLNYISLRDFKIDGGRRGIYVLGGNYALQWDIAHIIIGNNTAEAFYIANAAYQSGVADDLLFLSGTHGLRLAPTINANGNSWKNMRVAGTSIAGILLDASSATFTVSGNIFDSVVVENNGGVGVILNCVRNITFLNCHFEQNGTVTATSPDITVLGKAAYATQNINFIGCTHAPLGTYQSNLALQVQSEYVYGPIRFSDCLWSTGAIVDLGTYTARTLLAIEGSRPTSVNGNRGKGTQQYFNNVRNGSFEHFNEGTAVAPSLWELSGATAARVAGNRSPYAAKVTTAAANQYMIQWSMEKYLKPNTVYTFSFSKKVTALTATSVDVRLYDAGVPVQLATYTSTDAAWVDVAYYFKTDGGLAATCGIGFIQIGAGGAVIEIDDVMITEGPDIKSFAPHEYDANLYAGVVTLTANQPNSTVADTRISGNSVITFMPTTANAAAEIGAGTMYVSTRTPRTSFVITHANNAQVDRTFGYKISN